VRHIIQSHQDLPLALQKASIIALTKTGDQVRTQVAKQVDDLLQACSISREEFTGQLKVTVSKRMVYDSSPRILKRFLPALARVYYSAGKVDKFEFRGTGMDRVGTITIQKLLDPKITLINALSLSFRKLDVGEDSESFSLFVSPEEPRRAAYTIQPLRLTETTTEGWRNAIINPEDEWWRPWKITISVQEDRGYYIRRLNKYELSAIEKRIPEEKRYGWREGLVRARYYPKGLFPVVCHVEDGAEVVDSLPRFGIDLSRDVKTTCT